MNKIRTTAIVTAWIAAGAAACGTEAVPPGTPGTVSDTDTGTYYTAPGTMPPEPTGDTGETPGTVAPTGDTGP